MIQILPTFWRDLNIRELPRPAAFLAICLLTCPEAAPDGVIDWPVLGRTLHFSPEDSAIAVQELAARWMIEFSFDDEGLSGPTARVGAELLAFLTPASAARFMPEAAAMGAGD